MNGICGWMGVNTGSADDDIKRMQHALSADMPAHAQKTGPGWAVAMAGLDASQISIHSGNGLTVAIFGRPRFDNTDLERERQQTGPSQVLASLYVKQQEQAFVRLRGAFTAVVIDPVSNSITLAIDRMGVHSMTYTMAGTGVLFSTSCDAINAHPAAKPQIDLQAIYHYLYFHMVPAPDSIYRGYCRLLPGEYAIFRNGHVTQGQYWSMHFEEGRRAPFSELKEEFLSTLREAVREAARGVSTGCFLSGGTDSSTMSGLLTEVNGAPVRTYSIGFDEPGYDEMDYARIAAKHFGTDQHEYYVTPEDIVDAIPLIAGAYDQPFGNSSAVPTYYCARMARRDGVELLIGGDGGDELFGGNERYAKQHTFSLYEHIPEPLRNGLLSPLITRFPGAGKLPVLRKAKSYVEQASVPMPARLETYNLLDRIGRSRILTPDFLARINQHGPLEHINGIYHGADAKSLINRMLALDFRITLADSDLPKVVTASGLAGMEVAFPMLADAVVAFSAKLSPDMKLKGTRLRYFFKEALRGFLPDAIISKQKHGFGLPFGRWLTRHGPLQDLVSQNLKGLKRRGIVQPAFIDELTNQRLSAHAGYYGTMVWVLVMLELWLQKHGADDFGLH